MPSKSNFRLSHGGAFSIMYHRTRSGPYLESASKGLTTLPSLFDILLPDLSSTSPLEITFLNATPGLLFFLLTACISALDSLMRHAMACSVKNQPLVWS